MSKKLTKLVYLVIVLAMAAGVYFVVNRYLETEQKKRLRIFEDKVNEWMRNIKRWQKEPGNVWYTTDPADMTEQNIRAAALWQIKVNQSFLIPPGYTIAGDGVDNWLQEV
jgi:hypothetical protein